MAQTVGRVAFLAFLSETHFLLQRCATAYKKYVLGENAGKMSFRSMILPAGISFLLVEDNDELKSQESFYRLGGGGYCRRWKSRLEAFENSMEGFYDLVLMWISGCR